jgi:prevent-host-death family protein
MDTYTPTNARKNLYGLIKDVNLQKKPVVIEPANGNEKEAAVLVSKEDWDSIQETIYLENVGVMDKVRAREQSDDNDFEDVDDINWDEL